MVHVADIHRHPLKGWTPESLPRVTLEAGGGLPFDRHFAFTSGRREEVPKPGGWVQARTFLQLTVFPELAAFRCSLSEEGVLSISAPDGSGAQARVGAPESFAAANSFIQSHFEPGPYGAPYLVEQRPGHGHWDFTDTQISIINLATVRAIAEAVGQLLERERFRGNLYIDGLAPWAEFAWPGRRLAIGDLKLDVLRPIQRCAMTSTEPGTGERAFDLPAIMNERFGHNFCGVYARVASGGEVAQGDEIACGTELVLDPHENLPERAAHPALWPRFASFSPMGHALMKFTSAQPCWPLVEAEAGQGMRILRTDIERAPDRAPVVENGPDGLVCHVSCPLPDEGPALISGPFGRS
ncbi:MAG: MOSC N-terminal beta barrel domain-containing protein [Pseudomonadota bacterium]